MKQILTAGLILILAYGCSNHQQSEQKNGDNPEQSDMQFIPGGTFTMGSDSPDYPIEGPAHAVIVGDFFIDKTEVTNTEFKEFTEQTGYVTTAEVAPTWEELKAQLAPGTPQPDVALTAGSVVYVQLDSAVM